MSSMKGRDKFVFRDVKEFGVIQMQLYRMSKYIYYTYKSIFERKITNTFRNYLIFLNNFITPLNVYNDIN